MNNTFVSVHNVVDVKVREVEEAKSEPGMRWQVIEITTDDGSITSITAFLDSKYAGMAFMQRPPTPERRVDDMRNACIPDAWV